MPESLERILAELDRAISTPGNDARAEAAVNALAALPPEQAGLALEVLQGWLAAAQPDRRWWAARAAAVLPGEAAVALLTGCLGDPDPALRQCAALGLRERSLRGLGSSEPAVPALAQALADPDNLTRRLAGDALAAAGSAAVPALLEALQRSQPQATRLEAVRALAQIGDPRSVPALFDALDDDSALMEYWAAEGLERMGIGMVFFMP